MDFYGGYKTTFGDFGLDVGGILYYYPGSKARTRWQKANGGAAKNKELYVGGSGKFLSLKYSYLSIDDYFDARLDANGSTPQEYLRHELPRDLSANYDLGDGWGVIVATSATCTPRTCARAATATGKSG